MRVKLNVSERFKHVGPIVEEDTCIEIRQPLEGVLKTNMWDISGNELRWEFIKTVLLESPEKLGVSSKEFKLKRMYNQKVTITDEIELLLVLVREMEKEKSVKEGLNLLTEDIKNILEDEEDEPEWYLEYGKKNSLVEEML